MTNPNFSYSTDNYLPKHLANFRRCYEITFCSKNISINVEPSFRVCQNFFHILCHCNWATTELENRPVKRLKFQNKQITYGRVWGKKYIYLPPYELSHNMGQGIFVTLHVQYPSAQQLRLKIYYSSISL